MSELVIGKFLLYLSLLFGFTYLLAGVLERVKIPNILAALFTAMILKYTPLYPLIEKNILNDVFQMLAEFGVLFLLFFIGLQIDIKEMKSQSKDIVLATVLNTVTPFIIGYIVMIYLGYSHIIAFVIGLMTMPTAEAVIVPILDEFNLTKTKVGSYIIGAGVLDDVIEVFLVAFVSIIIGERSGLFHSNSSEIIDILRNVFTFVLLAWLTRKYLLVKISKWLKTDVKNLIMISVLILFLFGGFAEYSDLGIVVGAIVAGILMKPVYNSAKDISKKAIETVSSFSYGFFGLIFFLWVGFSIDLGGIVESPKLTILFFMAAFIGKLIGIFLMVPMKKLCTKEAWVIGIGLNARLTTEIIVAKMLFDAKIIDINLFTAVVAAASLSTVIVPLVLSLLIKNWHRDFGEKNGI